LKRIDNIFFKVKESYPDKVRCSEGCSDCCYALFDLPLIEALYLNHHFNQLDENKRNEILIRADKADRKIYKIKRQAFKAQQKGEDEEQILSEIAKKRVRCPLLSDENKCELYDFRPVTCRVYGLPMAIHNKSHSCGFSGFEPGHSYPTVNMDKLYEKLFLISQELVLNLNTKYTELHTVLVPVSMALLTEYDESYLGIVKDTSPQQGNKATTEWVLGEGE
jgi:Fe-S-cluster containining protein